MGALTVNIITETADSGAVFPVVTKEGIVASLYYDTTDFKGVVRAVGDLQTDIAKVTGQKPDISPLHSVNDYTIVIGTLGKSRLIDELVKKKKLDVSDIKGKWESFVITTIENPEDKKHLLIIAGSDKRGTIYGIYELSRQLGISPWYWWADVPPKTKNSVYVLNGRFPSAEPKVKYRGIFINDEAPCFSGWAKEKFGGLNSKVYTHIFELLLRLRANFLWPAMWGNAFNEDDPENPRLADEYGIVMGTSHHEPMMRAQQEWTKHKMEYGNGEWNYTTNEAGLKKFWEDGLTRNKDYENIITLAMRGDGDIPMKDAGTTEKNFKLLERIMGDQRKIIKNVTHKEASQTPQLWALYSEVLEYYDEGMKIPDDVTILLCDDNWGDVRRLPEVGTAAKHKGGYGIYYHVDLHGAPRAYQWLNMTQVPHMWEQLQLTYSYGVDKIWILNVGDLKPNEYPMDFFLQMAWNPVSFNQNNLQEYARRFCEDKFGKDESVEASEILSMYCKYNGRVSAEMLDQKTYNLEDGEFLQVRNAYLALEARALRQYISLPDNYKDTYKELLLHPVRAMANLYDMYYAVAMNEKLAANKDIRANYWADYADACFKRDAEYTKDYNHNIAGGKWNHIMDQTHIGYKSWDEPKGGNIKPTVVRIKPEDAKQGGYVYDEKNGVVVMEAEHYYKCTATNKTTWSAIPDLGRTLSGMALLPYTENADGASLQYKMSLNTAADSVKLHLFFGCTLPFKKGGQSIAASFDGGKEMTWNINKDLTWENNYTKMYPAAAARMIQSDLSFLLPKTDDGLHVLTIRPLDPGIVIYKIVVDDGGYEKTYLKQNESPYKR